MFVSRKAQLTMFFLIAVVMLGMFWFVSYINQSAARKQLEAQADKVVADLLKSDALVLYVRECIEEATKESVVYVGQQGGNIYTYQNGPVRVGRNMALHSGVLNSTVKVSYGISKPTLVNGTDYPEPPGYPGRGQSPALDFLTWGRFGLQSLQALCDSSPEGANRPFGSDVLSLRQLAGIYVPICLSSMYAAQNSTQAQLEFAIENKLESCLNWSAFSNITAYNVTAGNPQVVVRLGDSQINIDAFYPLDIIVGGIEPFQRVADFHAKLNVRLKRIFELAALLSQLDSYKLQYNLTKEFEANTAWDSAMTVTVTTPYRALNRFDDLIVIEDSLSLIDGKAFQLQFIRENRWPVLNLLSYVSSWQENFDIVVIENQTITIEPNPDPDRIYDPDEDPLFYNYSGWKENCDEPFDFDRGVVQYFCSPDPTSRADFGGPDSLAPHNWTQSLLYRDQGRRNTSYTTTTEDIGPHNMTVWVCDEGPEGIRLCDWQILKIMVFDIPKLEVNGSNEYENIPNDRASIEDVYRLDTRETTSYFTVFEWWSWFDSLEPVLNDPFLLVAAEEEILLLPHDLYDIDNIVDSTFEQVEFEGLVTDDSPLVQMGLAFDRNVPEDTCPTLASISQISTFDADFNLQPDTDIDGDGLDDYWETYYASFMPESALCTGTICAILDPDDDIDAPLIITDPPGDGFTNLEEFIGCSSPLDATDTPPGATLKRGPYITHNISLNVLPAISNNPKITPVEVYRCLPHRSNIPPYPWYGDDPTVDPFQANHSCCSAGEIADSSWGNYSPSTYTCFKPPTTYGTIRTLEAYTPIMRMRWYTSPTAILDSYGPAFVIDDGTPNPSNKGMENDILKQRTEVKCSGTRGNICDGEKIVTISSEVECSDFEDENNVVVDEDNDNLHDYIIERCQGPSSSVNLVASASPTAYACTDYTPGNTFEKLFQVPNSKGGTAHDGRCSVAGRCSTSSNFDDPNGKIAAIGGAKCTAGYCNEPQYDPADEDQNCELKNKCSIDVSDTANYFGWADWGCENFDDPTIGDEPNARCSVITARIDLDSDQNLCNTCFGNLDTASSLMSATFKGNSVIWKNGVCCGNDPGEGNFPYGGPGYTTSGTTTRPSDETTDGQCSSYYTNGQNYMIDNDCDGLAGCSEGSNHCQGNTGPGGGECCSNTGSGSGCDITDQGCEVITGFKYADGTDYVGQECACIDTEGTSASPRIISTSSMNQYQVVYQCYYTSSTGTTTCSYKDVWEMITCSSGGESGLHRYMKFSGLPDNDRYKVTVTFEGDSECVNNHFFVFDESTGTSDTAISASTVSNFKIEDTSAMIISFDSPSPVDCEVNVSIKEQ